MTLDYAGQQPQPALHRAPCDTAQCRNDCPYAYTCSRKAHEPYLFIAWPAMALILLVAAGALL